MKKIKLLPSIIMLVLCLAVLGIGVYSATTGSNTISGTVTINAANPEVVIQVYNGSLSNSITGPITSRYGTTIPLGPLEFKTASGQSISNANTIDDVADIDLIFKVTNNSSEKLGVYFADSVVGSALSEIAAGTREDNILVTKPYNTGLVTATFNQYYPVNASATIYYIVSFHLNQLSTETVNIDLGNTLYLTVESYTSGLGKSMENYSITSEGAVSKSGSPSGALYIPSKIWSGGVVIVDEINSFFSATGITSIDIPRTVTSISGWDAFGSCNSLSAITGAENVTSSYGWGIVSSTAWWTAQTNNSVVYLGSVCLGAKGTCPSTVTITSGTKCIAGSAFSSKTALTSISIPNTVVRIGDDAFTGCTALSSFTYLGTIAQWNNVLLQDYPGWRQSCLFTEIVCSDGSIAIEPFDCCFVAGTKVTMADGTYKNIEDVVIGDIVLSMDEDTGMIIETVVEEIILNTHSKKMAKVYFEDGSYVNMTDYHPMYTEDGWHSITNKYGYDTLLDGDRVKTESGWKTITSIELYEYENFETTYNLSVNNPCYENCHNYFANDTLVHNC